jgi:hypothetical protein
MRTELPVVTDWMAARAMDRAARASWPVTGLPAEVKWPGYLARQPPSVTRVWPVM